MYILYRPVYNILNVYIYILQNEFMGRNNRVVLNKIVLKIHKCVDNV